MIDMADINIEALGNAFGNGVKKLAEADAQENARQAERDYIRKHRVLTYRKMVGERLPEVLRPYADLNSIDWPFDEDPQLQPSERLYIQIPGYPSMRVEIRKYEPVKYIIPDIKRIVSTELGVPEPLVEYSKNSVVIEDDYEMALGHLWRRRKEISDIQAELDAAVERRR